MTISKSIFRNYDIRGVYPRDFDDSSAYILGKALGSDFFQRSVKTVVVGRDDRESSPALAKSFIKGLLSTGRDITYIDITLTPIIHYLTCAKGFDAGVMVTASHNPKDYNGFRIDLANAKPFFGPDIENLYQITESEKFVKGKGHYYEENLSLDYMNFIKSRFSIKKDFKIVIDCGSGATSLIAPQVFSQMGFRVVPVYCSYDKNFPHGVPDPENPLFIDDLKSKVAENKADLGIGFDTDGDRVGIVDEKGESYSVDKVALPLAAKILTEHPHGKIVFDVKCSQLLEELIPAMGGQFEMIRTGHSYFTEKVLSGEAVMGVEFAGHMYFGDKYYGYDDGIYAALRVLELLDLSGISLSEVMSPFPKRVSSAELKLGCLDEQKFAVVGEVINRVKNMHGIKDIRLIDGVRANVSKNGWFLIRASNTSPYLSVRLEAESNKELTKIAEAVFLLLKGFEFVDTSELKNLI